MGEFTDRAKGALNKVVGGAKQQSGDPNTRAEGDQQKLKGDIQDTKGKIKGVLNDI